MSFGERLSAYIISEAMNERGLNAEFLDARKVVRTDNHFGYARVDFNTTNQLIRNISKLMMLFRLYRFYRIIWNRWNDNDRKERLRLYCCHFCGALKASSLEIWTDVDGMMTADPRKVKKAFTVKEMTYHEAMELSHFGAKVIFPATMQPAMVNHIPIWIKNTFIHHLKERLSRKPPTIKVWSSKEFLPWIRSVYSMCREAVWWA